MHISSERVIQMQDWREQAKKKNVEIIKEGRCQFCGSPVEKGVTQCVEISSMIIHKLNHADGIKNMTIFMCVDAHALQHPEIHGRWNNHYHLTRLELILNENFQWNYKLSPLLSEVLDEYKKQHQNERIIPSEPGKRGSITAYDIDKTSSEEEYIELVKQWAKEVYESYLEGHKISKKIASKFKEKINRKL